MLTQYGKERRVELAFEHDRFFDVGTGQAVAAFAIHGKHSLQESMKYS
jgi:hypothetical protein